MTRPADEPLPQTYAAKLEWMFTNITPAPGVKYPGAAVAKWVEANYPGGKLGRAAISKARNGGSEKPTADTGAGIAKFFGVNPRIWSRDPDEVRHAMKNALLRFELQGPPRTTEELDALGSVRAPTPRESTPKPDKPTSGPRRNVYVAGLRTEQQESLHKWAQYMRQNPECELPLPPHARESGSDAASQDRNVSAEQGVSTT